MAQKFSPGPIAPPEGGIYRIGYDPSGDPLHADVPHEVTPVKPRRSPDRRSPKALAYRRWYAKAAWRKLRAEQLQKQPWCRLCAEMDRWTRATVVDHRKPHRGDEALFFDPGNLDSLCRLHHNCTKQRLERGRRQVRVGVDGWPVDT